MSVAEVVHRLAYTRMLVCRLWVCGAPAERGGVDRPATVTSGTQRLARVLHVRCVDTKRTVIQGAPPVLGLRRPQSVALLSVSLPGGAVPRCRVPCRLQRPACSGLPAAPEVTECQTYLCLKAVERHKETYTIRFVCGIINKSSYVLKKKACDVTCVGTVSCNRIAIRFGRSAARYYCR